MATPANAHLPRILCLHGGGVSAEIFRLQCRGILSALASQFRFVFADGPFLCDAGPGILPVYADHGPYRRWLRWLPEHAEVEAGGAVHEIWWQVRDAMEADAREGGRGEWVGLLGFSQGAKLAGSILLEQQTRERLGIQRQGDDDGGPPDVNWRFAVLLAGRAPLASLRPETDGVKQLVTAAGLSEGFQFAEGTAAEGDGEAYTLRIPTLHVHGLQDAGLHLHERLLTDYCAPGSTSVVRWNGTHRVPFKKADVELVVDAIKDIARRSGVL